MRITFVLPRMTSTPSGGLKLQYQLAGLLVNRGHSVTVLHPMSEFRMIGARGSGRYAQLVWRRRRQGHRLVGWYPLDGSVRLVLVPFLAGWLLPAADVTLLTGWQTAAATRRPRRAAGRMAQVVYDYEFWMAGSAEFRARMAAGLSRPDVALFSPSAAVSRMLAEIGRQPAAVTPAGVDLRAFGCDVAPAERAPVVGFALRSDPSKGMSVMLEACELLHNSCPDATIACFGGAQGDLPGYVERLGTLSDEDLRRFYNRCQVYVLPSLYEGWGLPGLEAMACGAALVTTANGGSEEFARDGGNALVVPAGDPKALAGAVQRLLGDPGLRLALAAAGQETAQSFSLARAADALEQALVELAASGPKGPANQ